MTESPMKEPSPFGAPAEGRGRVVRWAAYGVVVLAAAGAVYFGTRDRAPDRAADPHAGMNMGGAGGDSARPVMLTADDARRIGVTYATAELGPLPREVRTVGQVTFDESRVRAISPKIDGWVEALHVNATGQQVSRGDPLLSVYSPMVVAAQEELLLARRLATDVAAGTAEARGGAESLVASARRRLAYWDVPEGTIAEIERSGQVRRTVTLRSDVGGVVVEKNVLEGQRIMAGDALYRVADLGVVWLEGAVFEQDLAAARVGQAVTATFEALPGEEWKGRIAFVYPSLDAETRTARVRVELPNTRLRLKPGMYATFRFVDAGRGDVLSVPRSAVLATGERSLVFVRRADGMLEPRQVTTGIATPERIQVLAGLSAGETVVASATFLVDAESNLGTVMGGMGDMPGMDMTAPSGAGGDGRGGPLPVDRGGGGTPAPAAPGAPPRERRSAEPPGMDHSGHEE